MKIERDAPTTILELDTDTTGAELTELADGSTTSLHSHASVMQVVPAGLDLAAGDYDLFVPMFKDTTGTPDRVVIVTVLSTTTVAVIEFKRLDNAWVFDPGDCAYDPSVTLNYTVPSQRRITAFAIDNPVSSGDRVVFIAGSNDAAPDTFEIDSIVLTPGSSTLAATAVVIAGANQPTNTNDMVTVSIPLSITRALTIFEDDGHFADITESTGTYTLTYDDAKVTAIDTSISVTGDSGVAFSGIVIGSQVLLIRAFSPAFAGASDNAWEMDTSASLTEEFRPWKAGAMGGDQGDVAQGAAAVTAIGGSFAVATKFGGTGVDGSQSAWLVTAFPLDSI